MSEERKHEIMGAVARGWCSEENKHKEMDVALATAITDEIIKMEQAEIINLKEENEKLKESLGDIIKLIDTIGGGPAKMSFMRMIAEKALRGNDEKDE